MEADQTVRKTIVIQSSPAEVWDALTNPTKIKAWLFGTDTISDWKVGSRILFTGSWEGTTYEDKGTILQYEPEKIFQYNYYSGFSGLPDTPENYSVITFELSPVAGGTELRLSQGHFATATQYEHSDANWEVTLKGLKEVVEG